MNNIKYANFLLIKSFGKRFYDKKVPGSIFAGMYMLTLITKDGFAGIKELQKEKEELEIEQVKKNVRIALKEKKEDEEIRKMVKEAINNESSL